MQKNLVDREPKPPVRLNEVVGHPRSDSEPDWSLEVLKVNERLEQESRSGHTGGSLESQDPWVIEFLQSLLVDQKAPIDELELVKDSRTHVQHFDWVDFDMLCARLLLLVALFLLYLAHALLS